MPENCCALRVLSKPVVGRFVALPLAIPAALVAIPAGKAGAAIVSMAIGHFLYRATHKQEEQAKESAPRSTEGPGTDGRSANSQHSEQPWQPAVDLRYRIFSTWMNLGEGVRDVVGAFIGCFSRSTDWDAVFASRPVAARRADPIPKLIDKTPCVIRPPNSLLASLL
jgi:hypothetical protein